jgi:hypothetical protein
MELYTNNNVSDITYTSELIPHLLFIHDFSLKNLNTKKVRD